jgi:hypothetical protein
MGEIIAVLSFLSVFGVYQIGVNKQNDSRLDNLRIELNDLRHHVDKHILVSAANQQTLEVRINASAAVVNAQLSVIDEKLSMLTQTIKTHFKN